MKPYFTTFNRIKERNCILSSALLRSDEIAHDNHFTLGKLLDRPLERKDLGKEIGSINYVKKSSCYFIKTKALQEYSFLPIFNGESTECVLPSSFTNDDNLKAGDIIISKDSNIGETVILDKDYPEYMLSGALYKLPLKNWQKYYILAFMKHPYFKQQLDRMVPKGATLKHAGTKFLDCKIPFPGFNKDTIINYVSSITKRIIDIEIEIKRRNCHIDEVIDYELNNNQSIAYDYKYKHATYSTIKSKSRLDTGIYSDSFQHISFIINNYLGGAFCLDPDNLKSGSTPKVRIIDSSQQKGGFRWITPTHCSDIGYIQTYESIAMPTRNNIESDATLLINRTSRGGKGEYVGIATFYDFKTYGKGHHNQGIYRIIGYDRKMLVFITCFMNTAMMRKYCSALCVGSKMKEIKSEQFLSIPIPKFPDKILDSVYDLFYSDDFDNSVESILSTRLDKLGLFNLSTAKETLTHHLNSLLDKIIKGLDLETT